MFVHYLWKQIRSGKKNNQQKKSNKTISFCLFNFGFYLVACNLNFQQHTNTHQQQQKKRKRKIFVIKSENKKD
jgi:hypothetical protein